MSDEDAQSEDEEGGNETTRDNLTASDRFVLNVLKSCPGIRHLELHMHKITDMSGKILF